MSPFDRLLAIMTRPIVAAIYISLVIFAWLYIDRPLAYFLHEANFGVGLPILKQITRLGLGGIYLPTFFLLALFFRYYQRDKEREACSWLLFMCAAIPSIICLFLKVIFGRARPCMLFDDQFFGFYGLQWHAPFWSFPSGHTTTVTGAMLGLAIVFPRYFYGFFLFALTVALSRVLLTSHYLSDVMVAAYLTLLEVGALVYVLRRKSWLAPAWGDAV